MRRTATTVSQLHPVGLGRSFRLLFKGLTLRLMARRFPAEYHSTALAAGSRRSPRWYLISLVLAGEENRTASRRQVQWKNSTRTRLYLRPLHAGLLRGSTVMPRAAGTNSTSLCHSARPVSCRLLPLR